MRKIILILIIILISGCNNNSNNVDTELAKCIGKKSTLYVSAGCIACVKQQELFGENFKYLNKVNCAEEPEKCSESRIVAVPTWVIGGESYRGMQNIEKLKELTNCG